MTTGKSQYSRKFLSPANLWFGIVFILALSVRLLIIFVYQPVAFSDTPSYRRLADTILQGFTNYDGTRTPGYPAFLALVGSDQNAWLVQLLLGLVTTLLLFFIAWKLTDRPWFGGLVALAHTFNLGQLFFESDLLTESLTTFLVVLTMAGLLVWFLSPARRTLWLGFSLGLVSTLALLVRPLFIYLPFVILLAIWLAPPITPQPSGMDNTASEKDKNQPKPAKRFSFYTAIAFLLPVVVLLGGWVTFIHSRFGDWSLTTMTGYHLMQHTGNFFEYVPDEYATLRDIYIRYRDAHIAEYGTQTNTIWEAIPEMSQATGYSFYALSNVLARISIQLILKHPLLYLESAVSGWWMFWRAAVYWSADALRFPWMAGGIRVAIQIERAVLFLTNLVFIAASLVIAVSEGLAAFRRNPSKHLFHLVYPTWRAYSLTLLATIWIASIIQTLLDHGDNPRFLVPLQSLVVLWVASFVLQVALERRKSGKPSTNP